MKVYLRGPTCMYAPMEACLFCPTIMAHSTMAAPELSMQLSIVFIFFLRSRR